MSLALRFLVEIALFGVITMLLAAPVVIIGIRKRLSGTIRRFVVGGAFVAITCGLLSLSSDELVRRCIDAGNTGCLDFGVRGMQLLVLGVYAVASLLRAVSIYRS